MKQIIKNLTLLAFILGWFSISGAAKAQSSITFSPPHTEVDFPNRLSFEITVTSTGEEIVSAELLYHVRTQVSSTSFSREKIEIEPAKQVILRFDWDTEGTTVFPSTPYLYHWEVTDSAGNEVVSDEFFVRYIDTRYDWNIQENSSVAVWAHDRPNSFGETVFEIANSSLADQYPLFGVDLDYQIHIIIYNTNEEFADWHAVRTNAIGGEANSDIGVTAQIVGMSGFTNNWLNDVIPHEISHLYFAQATANGAVDPPNWLNEGVAMYNEFNNNSSTLRAVESAAARGDLIILSTLNDGFGRLVSEERFRFAYDVSLSAVIYMVETFGERGLANLLANYKSGLRTDEGFLAAFGVDMTQFELDWAAWVGVPEGEYLIPTPWALPDFPASPTPFIPGSGPSNYSTRAPEIALAELTLTAAPPVSPPGQDNPGSFSSTASYLGITCLLCLGVIVAGTAGIILIRKRKMGKAN